MYVEQVIYFFIYLEPLGLIKDDRIHKRNHWDSLASQKPTDNKWINELTDLQLPFILHCDMNACLAIWPSVYLSKCNLEMQPQERPGFSIIQFDNNTKKQ